jgi:hypothetical protein
MSGLIKAQVQLGDNATATNKFVLDSSAANGTMKLSRGTFGATTQDILTVAAGGAVDLPTLARSLGANGYYTMPGGFIIQWGNYAFTSYTNAPTITFPIAFPTGCMSATVFLSSSGNGAIPRITALSTTSFKPTYDSFSTASNTACTAYWIAIGY